MPAQLGAKSEVMDCPPAAEAKSVVAAMTRPNAMIMAFWKRGQTTGPGRGLGGAVYGTLYSQLPVVVTRVRGA